MKVYTLLITNTEYKLVVDNVSYSGEKLDELLAVLDDKGIKFDDFNEVITTDDLSDATKHIAYQALTSFDK